MKCGLCESGTYCEIHDGPIYPWKALPQVDPARIAAIVDLTALQHVEGFVWCDKNGGVHDDSLNPYGYTRDPETVEQSWCKPEDHRPLYMEPDDMPDPEPVRSIPVPLTVRRHTEQSRQIFYDNLMAALPADMLDEDKEKITNELLDVAVAQGNLLRRKRIIDKLMLAAEEMEDRATSGGARKNVNVGTNVLNEWSDMLADAAEEIRSVL